MYFLAAVLLTFLLQSPAAAPRSTSQAEATPRFKDYAVHEVFRSKPAKIIWPSGIAPGNRNSEKMVSAVELTLPRKSNFAGHYAIVEYSCGTECSQVVVVDMKSGMVLDSQPYVTMDVDLYTKNRILYKGLVFKLRSRLLIASGCFDWDSPESPHECGTKYFELRDSQFVLLSYVLGPVPQKFKSR
jgi:hypothetical protein